MPGLLNSLKNLFQEPSAKNMTTEQLAEQLEENANPLAKHMRTAKDSDTNRAHLSRIIGIERWGQVRLKVFLGEDLVTDTYEAYRPLAHLDWDSLTAQFWSTRKETVALARQLAEIDETTTVPHHERGDLTAKEWLHYLYTHAKRETKRIH